MLCLGWRLSLIINHNLYLIESYRLEAVARKSSDYRIVVI